MVIRNTIIVTPMILTFGFTLKDLPENDASRAISLQELFYFAATLAITLIKNRKKKNMDLYHGVISITTDFFKAVH